MQRSAPYRFPRRFVALSVVLHAAPFATLPMFERQPPEPSPPPSQNPRGVSLVFVEANPSSSIDQRQQAHASHAAQPDRPALARRGGSSGTPPASRPLARARARARAHAAAPEPLAVARPVVQPSEAAMSRASLSSDAATPEQSASGMSTFLAGMPVAADAGLRIEQQRRPRTHNATRLQVEARLRRERGVARPVVLAARALPATVGVLLHTASESEGHVVEGHGPGETDGLERRERGERVAQQDRERVLELIRQRIHRVMPLVYWDHARKDQIIGEARLRFRVDRLGYVHEIELLGTRGGLEVEAASRTVLHLAEPYIFVPGWIELNLAFRG